MNNNKSVKNNMVMNIILTTSNFIFPLITYAYVARILLPAGTGRIAFVQAALSYFSYIATLGISNYGIRECAKVRDNKEKLSILVQELLQINMFSTFVAYVALIISIFLVPRFHENALLFLIMSGGILLQTLGMEWLYKSLEKYTYITIRSIIFKCISVALVFLLVKKEDDYLIYGGLTIFATSASCLLNFINSRKILFYKKYDHYNLQQHIRPILVFFFSTIIITIYTNFDTLMIGFIKTDTDVGLYNSTVKMKNIVTSISTAITSVLIPRLSIFYNEKKYNLFNDYICKSFRISLLVIFPISSFVILNSRDILDFVCGNQYVDASVTLCIVMFCTMVLSVTNLFGNQILIPTGNEKRLSKSVLVGMFINLVLNALLIPYLSYLGAAIATLITESYNAFYMGLGCKEQIYYLKKKINIRSYFLPLLIALLIEFLVQNLTVNLNLVFRLIINAALFFCVFYVLEFKLHDPIILEGINYIRYSLENSK